MYTLTIILLIVAVVIMLLGIIADIANVKIIVSAISWYAIAIFLLLFALIYESPSSLLVAPTQAY